MGDNVLQDVTKTLPPKGQCQSYSNNYFSREGDQLLNIYLRPGRKIVYIYNINIIIYNVYICIYIYHLSKIYMQYRYATLYFKLLHIIKSQSINSLYSAIRRVFDNFFLFLIRIMKSSWTITQQLFMFLKKKKCAAISLDLLTVTNIKLNGNTAGFFPMLSKINLQINLQRTTRRYL